ncbi:hypothetical protein MUO14_20320 [Halobacillus shinanisalinarum]|uniref:Uncharacterized protein n=1 Tax=Halobacillus shinanisalinarum TaxID=2932258 RepID=A0ABY4H186_9BACI|nr:hypothetical protein [Halobacillus shinanisalinarum]UOQ92737.1 hypothetical protein MUO14_20320 [Halobacillus shinanisalinarum]
MERDTEKQILEELKNINQSLEDIKEKNNDIESSPIIFDIVKSLLIGILIVGPAIAVVMVIFQILISWMFN